MRVAGEAVGVSAIEIAEEGMAAVQAAARLHCRYAWIGSA
jgi:hypothetical protein